MSYLDRLRDFESNMLKDGTAKTAKSTLCSLCSSPSRGKNDFFDLPVSDANHTEAREAFEERAAIIEFDSGLSRDEAERLAMAEQVGGAVSCS